MNEAPRAALARAIRARRAELKLTQADLAQAAGISVSAIQKLEDPKSDIRRPRSLPKVERALKWEPGSADAVLDGGTATPLAAPTPESTPPAPLGNGIDPEFLIELASSTPEQLQRVRDFLYGIKQGGQANR